MSLWLQSYCGYDGLKNIININDPKSINKEKVYHILKHLSMNEFFCMSENAQYNILNEAQLQLNKNDCSNFSLSELLALKHLTNDLSESIDLKEIKKKISHILINKLEVFEQMNRFNHKNLLINDIPRRLNNQNIDQAILNYKKLVDLMPKSIGTNNSFDLLKKIKREPIKSGPYPSVSISEAANRIMSDLIILNGVKLLLNGVFSNLIFTDYYVEYGTESKNKHDITSEKNGISLKGEVFNVSKSLFQWKKTKSINKLKQNVTSSDIILLMFNDDASLKYHKPTIIDNIFYLPVAL